MHSAHRALTMEIDLSASPFPWWEWDVQMNEVTINDLKVSCLGYDPADFRGCGYQAFTSLVHPEDLPHTMQAMHRLLAGQSDIYQTTYRIRNCRGEYQWFMDRGSAIAHDGKAVLKVRGLVLNLGSDMQGGADVKAVLSLLNTVGNDHDALLTVCSACKRVRINGSAWAPVSSEFRIILADRCSHGLCMECLVRLYPEMAERIAARLAGVERTAIVA